MDLSNDLISQFVKITNDGDVGSKESTVYGTTVEYNGELYVKLDGSDLLTPVETTSDMQAGERVTVMIKNHGATVTGNITSPSANEGTVGKKVTEAVEGIEGKVITEVEILIADRVSTKQLDAELARIDTLIAGKATIEELEAIDAKIENLEVGDLTAVNAEIENLKANKADITELNAVTANIEILDAEVADIQTLVNGNLTSDNILSFHITADKVTVDDAFISDAMIANVNAGKITAGTINTSLVSVQSEDGGLIINGSTQQFKDADGNVRIQIGRDSTGDFTFVLYGTDGQGQLINQNGITASAIGDGLIVNDMVADNAAISGGKLDISSVITEINSDNSTTIKSSKIYLNEQGQSLEVAFNSLKKQVNTIQDVTVDGDLTSIIDQVTSNTTEIEVCKNGISTLVGEDAIIKKQVRDLNGTVVETAEELTAKYTKLEQDVSGFKTSVADTYATKKTVSDLSNNLSTNYSTTSAMKSAIAQSATDITSSVSSTYATKKSVTDLETNLTTNYSTTSTMNTAINQSASQINFDVSKTYQTKSDMNKYSTTEQMNAAIDLKAEGISSTVSSLKTEFDNLAIGGNNLIKNSTFLNGSEHWSISANCSIDTTTTPYPSGLSNQSGLTSDAWRGFGSRDSYVDIYSGETYTASCYVYVRDKSTLDSSGVALEVKYDNTRTIKYTDLNASEITNNEWTRLTITFTADKDYKNCYVVGYVTRNGTAWFNRFQLEKGNKATEWRLSNLDLDDKIDGVSTELSAVEQTADKINWLVKSGTSSSNMTLTDKVYSLVSSNINLTADHIDLHGYVTANNGFSIDVNGNMTAQNGTFSGNITGSTFSSANDVFRVVDDGTVNSDYLVIDKVISTKELNVDVINNREYPKAMHRATTVYINQKGTDSTEFYHGAEFTSIDALISTAPRNLNGYTLNINLKADYQGNISLSYFHSGQINLNFCGYTLYGYLSCYGNSMVYRVYGDTSETTSGDIYGKIMPYTGKLVNSYQYAVHFNYCTWAMTDMELYPDTTDNTDSGGICCERGMGAMYSIIAKGNMRYLLRANYHGYVYVSSSSGTCNNATFCSTTGSTICLNKDNPQAGRNTSGNPYWTGSGGEVRYEGVTFSGTASSGSNTNTGATTSKLVVLTGKANTYRSTVYNNWKNDSTARQGDWGSGNCTGCWFFGDAFEEIKNKNITKVVIEFSRQSGGNHSAVTHKLYTHNHESKPSGAPTLGTSLGTVSVEVGGTAQLSITSSSLISAIKSAKGIAIRNTYSKTYYSVCSSGMRVIVYYKE